MNGLIFYLDAGNRKSYPGSGTTWTDLSNTANNGTLTNMDGTNFNSANAGTLTFDGTNEYVSVSDSSSLDVDYVTLSCWFKTSQVRNSEIVMKNNAVNTSICYGFQIFEDSFIYSHINTSTGGWNEIPTDTYQINTWYNLCLTYNGSSFITYLNGVLKTTTSTTGTIIKNNQNLYIGSPNNTLDDSPYFGNISQVSIYNRALTQSEIKQNFNAIRSRFGI